MDERLQKTNERRSSRIKKNKLPIMEPSRGLRITSTSVSTIVMRPKKIESFHFLKRECLSSTNQTWKYSVMFILKQSRSSHKNFSHGRYITGAIYIFFIDWSDLKLAQNPCTSDLVAEFLEFCAFPDFLLYYNVS